MSFRDEDPKYKEYKADWALTMNRAYHPGKGTLVSELDNLMLASYRLMRYIKHYLRGKSIDVSSPYIDVPLLPKALKEARKLVEQQNGIISLFKEAEILEAVSKASYRWLSENKQLVEIDGP